MDQELKDYLDKRYDGLQGSIQGDIDEQCDSLRKQLTLIEQQIAGVRSTIHVGELSQSMLIEKVSRSLHMCNAKLEENLKAAMGRPDDLLRREPAAPPEEDPTGALKSRVDDLEKRLRELEAHVVERVGTRLMELEEWRRPR